MHFGRHVLPVEDDLLAPRRTQGDMQHGAILGTVDFVAAEHRINVGAQAACLGEGEQKLDGLGGDARAVDET